jgi:drug/metabolite transporter (DMT)-like permease
MKKNLPAILLSYLAIYIVWGSTYLAIRFCVASLPPFYLVAFRFLPIGLVFLLISVLSGKLRKLPTLKEVLSASFLGLFLILGGNGLVSVGEMTVDSYMAAVVISSTPFCVALFNRVLFKERLSLIRIAGMLIGLAGVVVLMYEGKGLHFTFGRGTAFVVGGFISWGFATSVGRRLPVHENNLVNSGIEMTLAGIVAFILSLFLYRPLPLVLPEVTARSWWGLLYLATIGAAAFAAYNYLLKNEPSSRVVSYSIVNPLIAVLLGIVLAGEKPVPWLPVAVPFIIAGLVLMLYGDTLAAAFARRRDRGRGS